jgi:excisionase family DNA binding protein
MSDLLTTTEAAKALGFKNSSTFLRWAKRVRFPLVRLSHKAVRARRKDVERWAETSQDYDGLRRIETD